MPRDRKSTADCQDETEEEAKDEIWMPELFDTPLDRFPRIALGIYATGCPSFGHLLRGVGAECCRAQHAEKGDDNYDTDGT